MSSTRYLPLGPLHAGEGSRAVLGLAVTPGAPARPIVLVYAPDEVLKDAQLAEHLERETARAMVFDHPNIIKVHGLIEVDQRLARVTEYADGEPLRRLLDVHTRLPPTIAAWAVAEAAKGAHYAHVAGNDDGSPFVHGDLRPETLMLTFSGGCKVMGYGALGVAPKESIPGRRVVQRRVYCAPEQLLGGREAVNVQTDVYLFGLILYECLTGTVLFKDVPNFDQAVLNKRVPPLPGEVPSAFDKVVRRALAKRAQERFPTVMAFREALIAAAGELPSQEEVAAYIESSIPSSDETRVARRKLIEQGVAMATSLSPAATRVPVPAAVVAAAAKPAPAATAPVQRPVPIEPDDEPSLPPKPSRSWLPWAIVGVLAVGMGVLLLGRSGAPKPVPVSPPEQPVAPVAQPEPALDAGTLATSPPAAEDAGSLAAVTPPVEPPPPPPPPVIAEPTSLDLTVEPPVTVTLKGRDLGQTPWVTELPPGRHVLSLVNKAQGIRTTRTVTVGTKGRTKQRITLAKGSVAVMAPDGCTILIDGKKVGMAPMDEVPVYEGSHQIMVTFKTARWKQDFTVQPGERMDFTVEFD